MPRTKKPPGTAVDKRNGARLVSVGQGKVEPFDPPRGLTAAAKAAWEAYWSDRPALLLTPSSKVVLLRWIDGLDRYLRATRAADAEPLIAGSRDQQTLNPLYRVAEQARAVVEACERQLGIGGLYAANLGLAAVSEAKSLADLNAAYSESGGDGDEHADPRVVHIGTAG